MNVYNVEITDRSGETRIVQIKAYSPNEAMMMVLVSPIYGVVWCCRCIAGPETVTAPAPDFIPGTPVKVVYN